MEKSNLSPIINLEVDQSLTKTYETHCLIGKIILHRPLDEALVKSFTQTEWRCRNGVTVSNISRNMFMFVFQDRDDLVHVLKNRPWSIMGGLLILSAWCSTQVPNEMKFSYSAFWVQAHGLPMDYLTKRNGSKICEVLGEFVYTDWEICCGRFLRLRVVLDVRKPVVTGFWLRRAGSKDVWIEFRYEKLGVFCYKCGLIGNSFRSCRFAPGEAKFGPWLRADSRDSKSGGGSVANAVCGRRAMVVDRRRVDQNVCTTLLAVPKAEPSNLGDIAFEDAYMDCETTHQGGDNIHRSKLCQRLIFNSIDSTIMLMNCVVVFSRMKSVDESEGSWLLVLMAAYVFHLLRKFVSVKRGLKFFKARNGMISSSDCNGKAFAEILILILSLVILVSF